MTFSILSMHGNKIDFRKTMAAKQTNKMTLPQVALMHTMCSIKPFATRKTYIICDRITYPCNKKPERTLLLSVRFWVDWFVGLTPRTIYFIWTVWKIFILNFILKWTDFYNCEYTTYPTAIEITTEWRISYSITNIVRLALSVYMFFSNW